MLESDPIAESLRDTLWVGLQLGGPLLGAMLVVGLVVAVIQALTQVQEASLAFLPKLAAAGLVLLLGGPFMLGVMRAWTHALFERMVVLGGMP